ncbi:glycogen-binding subunit 76A-like [Artemia franciscana]|uniref:glycogen-binding subunit 76A-like n=1 Tax=Artemia franciscana TaxID=6661 RepID=UPI0032DB1142
MNSTPPERHCTSLYKLLGLNCANRGQELTNSIPTNSYTYQTEVRCNDKGCTEIIVTSLPNSGVVTAAPKPITTMPKMLNFEKAMIVKQFLASAGDPEGKTNYKLANNPEDFDFGFESPPELAQEDSDSLNSDVVVNEDTLPPHSSVNSDSGQSMDSDTLQESDDELTFICEDGSLSTSPLFSVPEQIPDDSGDMDVQRGCILSENIATDEPDFVFDRQINFLADISAKEDFSSLLHASEETQCLSDNSEPDTELSSELQEPNNLELENLPSVINDINNADLTKFEQRSENLQVNGDAMLKLSDHPDACGSCNDSGIAADDDENSNFSDSSDDEEKQRMKRSSSLRTWKTPPGTPGQKKIVRFADAMGLDLADVRHFLDGIPNIPKSAFQDLDIKLDASEEDLNVENVKVGDEPQKLNANFATPGALPDFIDKVKNRNVCLETAVIEKSFLIKGIIRVLNKGYYKSVVVRYTTNEWKTFRDNVAEYVPNSCDGLTDKFEFSIPVPQMKAGDRILFAICYRVSGQEFWDNNCNFNYSFTCVSSYLYPVCPPVPQNLFCDGQWAGFL